MDSSTPRAVASATPPRPSLRLGIMVLDGALMSSIGSPIDALRIAEKIANLRRPADAPRFITHVFSARGQTRIRTSNGLFLEGIEAPPEALDVLLVPGVMADDIAGLCGRVHELKPETEYLRRAHAAGVRIAAACSGTLLVAESGLLDGRRATTSWWLAAQFKQQDPRVLLDAERMVVDDERLITAGAATAILNLVIRLIAEAGGNDLAQQVSRMLAFDAERQSQAPYVSMALLERPRTSLAEKAESYLRKELGKDIRVSGLAEHCGTSERSLLRHFKAHYGTTPLEHIQHLRVERAKAMLEATHLSFEEIVDRCGYRDVSSFRKLFKRDTALTPVDYRERFRLRAR